MGWLHCAYLRPPRMLSRLRNLSRACPRSCAPRPGRSRRCRRLRRSLRTRPTRVPGPISIRRTAPSASAGTKTAVTSTAARAPSRSRPARASSAAPTVSPGAKAVLLTFITPVTLGADTASTALMRRQGKTIWQGAATACTSCKRACTQRGDALMVERGCLSGEVDEAE